MRVLMIGSGLSRCAPDGTGLAGEALALGLRSLQCEVVLLLPGVRSPALPPSEPATPFRLIRVDASLVRYGRTAGLSGEDRRDVVSRLAAVARVVARQERFDVIHAHDWMAFPAALAALAESGRPLLAHVHATGLAETGIWSVDPFIREIEHTALRRAERVLCVSPTTAGAVRRRHGVEPGRIRIVQDAGDAGASWSLPASRCLEAYREVSC